MRTKSKRSDFCLLTSDFSTSGFSISDFSLHRSGLTLIEMMVALALTIFMMAILSEAFVKGLEAFRKLKAIADMDSQLRNTVILLRTDLTRNHFGNDEKVSDANLYDPTHRPKLGFFSYTEGELTQTMSAGHPWFEGTDQFQFPSFRSTKDVLHFTVRGDRNKREGWYRSNLPLPSPLDSIGLPASRYDGTGNAVYTSQWGEVLWFLVPDGQQTAADDTLVPQPQSLGTYSLYRQQLLLVPELDPTNGGPLGGSAAHLFPGYDISCRQVSPTAVLFNSPADVQFRQRRWGGRPNSSAWYPENSYPTYPNGPYLPFGSTAQGVGPGTMYGMSFNRTGADLVMTNVLSLDVKVWDPRAIVSPTLPGGFRGYFVDLGHQTPDTLPNRRVWGLDRTESINTLDYEPNPYVNLNANLNGAYFYGNGDQPTNTDPDNLSAPTPYVARTYDTMSFRDAVTYVPPPTDAYVTQLQGASGRYSADGFNPVYPVNAALPYQPNPSQANYNPARKVYPVPYRLPIQMIQVQIRVWDMKTKQTRQVTIVQDM